MSSVQLTQAVTSGDAGAVSTVLANGADVNERTGGGQTPLILATIFGHTHLIPLLLEAGGDPQLRDNLGLNAVDWAQRRGETEAIELFTNKPRRRSSVEARVETATPVETRIRVEPPAEPNTGNHRAVSQAEKSQRWLAGLKQRIAEQSQQITERSQRDATEGANTFMRQPEPPPEIPELPRPTPEIPELPTPQPEIPKPGPDVPELPKPELPGTPPELPKPVSPIPPQPQPEIPAEPPVIEPPTTEPPITEPPVAQTKRRTERNPATSITAPPLTVSPVRMEPPITEPAVAQLAPPAEVKPATPRSARKRCPKCGAVYTSELVAYCAHHFVPLVDEDQSPIISEPPKASPVVFWMIIIITLTGSLVVGSVITAFFYNSSGAEPQAASAPSAPTAVQKGTPVVGPELEGKVVSLPIAECPLNGQEAIPGTVVVRVTINRTGQVRSATASGGDWLLRGAASEAALKSTFAPEKLRSRETEGTITYTFEP